MSNDQTSYNLGDTAIAQIVQLIQLGILTGTDVSDQIRTLKLVFGDNNSLVPCPDYVKIFNENIEKMQSIGQND